MEIEIASLPRDPDQNLGGGRGDHSTHCSMSDADQDWHYRKRKMLLTALTGGEHERPAAYFECREALRALEPAVSARDTLSFKSEPEAFACEEIDSNVAIVECENRHDRQSESEFVEMPPKVESSVSDDSHHQNEETEEEEADNDGRAVMPDLNEVSLSSAHVDAIDPPLEEYIAPTVGGDGESLQSVQNQAESSDLSTNLAQARTRRLSFASNGSDDIEVSTSKDTRHVSDPTNSAQEASNDTAFPSNQSERENEGDWPCSGVSALLSSADGSAITCVAFSPRLPNVFAFGSQDGTVSLAQCVRGSSSGAILWQCVEHISPVTRISWYPVAEHLFASFAEDSKICLWNAVSLLRQIRLPQPLIDGNFVPANSNILLGMSANVLRAVNMSTGKCVAAQEMVKKPASLTCMMISHGVVLCGSNGGTLHHAYWDQRGDRKGVLSHVSLRVVGDFKLPLPTLPIEALEYINAAATICVGLRDGVWCFVVQVGGSVGIHPDTGAEHLKLHSGMFISASEIDSSPLRRSPMGTYRLSIAVMVTPNLVFLLAVAGVDGVVRIWEYKLDKSEPRAVNVLQGHDAPILDCAVNALGNLLATVDEGGNLIVWRKKDHVEG